MSVRPTDATATSSLKGHPPEAAIDTSKNTYWAEGAKGNGEKQVLTLLFDRQIDLTHIIVTSGASTKPQDFVTQPRPEKLRLTFSSGKPHDFTLDDTLDPQTIEIDREDIRWVKIQIVSVFGAVGKGSAAAIAEVEFRSRA